MANDIRFVRRNRVDERVAAGVAAVAGLAAVLAGLEPTGNTTIDALIVALAVGAATWAGASAPWFVGAGAAGIAAATSLSPLPALIGGLAFVCGLVVGLQRRDNTLVRVIVAGVALNVAAWSELEAFLGASAMVGVAIGIVLFISGVRRRPSMIRQRAWQAVGLVVGLVAIAALGLVVAAGSARPDITDGASLARSGIDELDAGNYDVAAQQFADAADRFAVVKDDLSGALAAPSRLLPVVAQNVTAGRELSGEAAEALAVAADALGRIDPSSLKLTGGRIDIEAIRIAEEALVDVEAALAGVRETIDDARSPWLISRLDQELDELDADFDKQQPRLENAVDAARVAPAVLGEGGVRRYLVLFTSPAEARGLGGFVGNFAEVEIADGQISVTDFARRSELEDAVRAADVQCSGCPEEFLQIYGRNGFTTGENGGVGDRGWSNITMAAHFPYVAQTAADLYPKSGGREVDGVIVMDPYVVQALMQYTGPIEVPELGTTVQPDNAANFILSEQYVLAGFGANPDRVDALETLGTEVIARLITGSLPEPVELADALAPLVSERRLLVWTDQAEEQDVLGRIGLLGALPELSESGGFSVAVTNAGASKIDVYLDRQVDVAVVEGADGPELEATVTLTNNAPASGLPRYVIGNSVGLPEGSSRLIVAFYGPAGLTTAVRDGEPVSLSSEQESGWFRYGSFVDLAPGGSTTYTLRFDLGGDPAPGDVDPVLFEQPLAART